MKDIFYFIVTTLGLLIALGTSRSLLKALRKPSTMVAKKTAKQLTIALLGGLIVGMFFAQALARLAGWSIAATGVLGIWVGATFVFLNLTDELK
jgi:hypothetical protein